MITGKLSEFKVAIGAELIGKDASFTGISIDTRTLKPGNLFIAVQGENFDGHNFIEQAINAGAAAIIVSKKQTAPVPQLQVKDTLVALGDLTHHWRKQFSLPLIGITGSNGKTSTKNMIASILTAAFGSSHVLATQGNFNNLFGVPLMLAQLNEQHHAAVIEIGMSVPGEIARLTQLISPDVAIVTNAGPSHVAGVGQSVADIAREKGAIFKGLSEKDAAILNADDTFYQTWLTSLNSQHVTRFGLENTAEITAKNIEYFAEKTTFLLATPHGETDITLPLPGKHNVMNALAASAACLATGLSLEAINKGLSTLTGTPGRLQRKPGPPGITLIDDTYNANPLSLKAAIDVLARHPGRKVIVLGDMGELGHDDIALHQQAATQMKAANIDALYTLGHLTEHTSTTFGENAQHFKSHEALIEALPEEKTSNTLMLIKGSRSMKMEKIVDSLCTALV